MKIILMSLFFVLSCSTTKDPGQKTVDYVDLDRFMGNWYEIARYETPLQSECGSAKINFKRQNKKEIEILHSCHEKEKGKMIHAKGIAEIADKKTNARLDVSYMPILKDWHMFTASLWIVELDPEYQFAILGHPTHKHLWIIARTPEITAEKYADLVARAKAKGYKTKELIRVPVWK